MKYLIDTNVLSEPLKLRPSEAVLARLARDEEEIAIPAPAWNEFYFGEVRAPRGVSVSPRKRAVFEEYVNTVLGRLPVVSYDVAAATFG